MSYGVAWPLVRRAPDKIVQFQLLNADDFLFAFRNRRKIPAEHVTNDNAYAQKIQMGVSRGE
jgi:hypothetical protein